MNSPSPLSCANVDQCSLLIGRGRSRFNRQSTAGVVTLLALFASLVVGDLRIATAQFDHNTRDGALVQTTSAADAWPAGTLERDRLPKARALDYDFDSVRIASILGWLRRVNVQPPVALEGIVSGWVWAQAPASGWWRLSNYRVEGELQSPLLDVDRFSIRQAAVRFGYRDGLWTIGRATGQIESRTEQGDARRILGNAKLNAQLPMAANGTVSASGQLSQVPLIDLLATFGIRENAPTGMAAGTFELQTTLANLSQPLAWNARGTLRGNQIVVAVFRRRIFKPIGDSLNQHSISITHKLELLASEFNCPQSSNCKSNLHGR